MYGYQIDQPLRRSYRPMAQSYSSQGLPIKSEMVQNPPTQYRVMRASQVKNVVIFLAESWIYIPNRKRIN